MKILIFGEPVAQGRPRFSSRNGFVRVHDPEKSAKYKKFVRATAEQCCHKPLEGALSVRIDVFRGIPASWSKKKREQANMGELKPTVKSDIDNYVKSVLDGLNKIAFYDDAQIVELIATKNYSFEPRVEIEIREV